MHEYDASHLVQRLKAESRQAPGLVMRVLKRLFLGLPAKTLEQFFFQLQTMLGSGVTIRESLHTLAGQHRGRAAKYFGEAAEQVQAGRPLSGAFAKRDYAYGRFAVAMTKAGEQSGRMDDNLRLVSKVFESFRRIRSQVITALIYPIILLHLGLVLMHLPLLFGTDGSTGAFLTAVFLKGLIPLYLLLFSLFVAHLVLRQTNFYSELILSLFVFGGVAKKTALARFSRSVASLYESGVPLGQAVNVSLEAAENGAIRNAISEATQGLQHGESFAEAIQGARHIPPMVKNMIATGEHSGSLGVTLMKVADFYEHEAETAIRRMAKIVPLVIYLAILGYFAVYIVRFWVGYYGRAL
ncbi:MAG: type II secretion system F family protein [Planctomycetota bacterium]